MREGLTCEVFEPAFIKFERKMKSLVQPKMVDRLAKRHFRIAYFAPVYYAINPALTGGGCKKVFQIISETKRCS